MVAKSCQACGKVMSRRTDFPRGNFSSRYCADCVDASGQLKPKEIIRANLIRIRVRTQKIDPDEAREIIDNLMQTLPAWRRQKTSVR
jgi:hypothetical protein